ncbi:MAG: hypothetical protein JW940_05775 [Polyangiaceae bacterium]|nr:hypothetical protein [Polyangiaceae bacterium]
MRFSQIHRFVCVAVVLLAASGCKESDKPAAVGQGAGKPRGAPSRAAPAPEVAPPGGCTATGPVPVQLATGVGSVLGFAGDATHLYYTSWQLYGSRGDLGQIRKDGQGSTSLVSLQLQPRAVVLDDKDIYYSEGIRLNKMPKAGGTPSTVAPKFSSQALAMDASQIYGVPGDYGPYDRLVKVAKTGGTNWELDVATRPNTKADPVGYSAIAVDASGAYVTDSGNNRVLKFPLERGKPKPLANGQPKAFDLAIDGSTVYFTLALKGQLMSVPKAGGKVTKLATGLARKSRIAADGSGIVVVFAGANEDAPGEVAVVPSAGGEPRSIAPVPPSQSVEAVALDSSCVYWVQREEGSGKLVFYAGKR